MMEPKQRSLLINDLAARIPYGVKLQVNLRYGDNGHREGTYLADFDTVSDTGAVEAIYYDGKDQDWPRDWTFEVEDVKPYLVSPSSLPAEDVLELGKMIGMAAAGLMNTRSTDELFDPEPLQDLLEVCYGEHIDINGLIPKGLALEAPKDMYGAGK